MNRWWWKILCIFLLLYTIVAGLNIFNLSLFQVPRKPIIEESIRNLYFHVCMWFGMITNSSIRTCGKWRGIASQSSCAINPAALKRTMPDLISPNSGARAFAQIVTKYAPR